MKLNLTQALSALKCYDSIYWLGVFKESDIGLFCRHCEFYV